MVESGEVGGSVGAERAGRDAHPQGHRHRPRQEHVGHDSRGRRGEEPLDGRLHPGVHCLDEAGEVGCAAVLRGDDVGKGGEGARRTHSGSGGASTPSKPSHSSVATTVMAMLLLRLASCRHRLRRSAWG